MNDEDENETDENETDNETDENETDNETDNETEDKTDNKMDYKFMGKIYKYINSHSILIQDFIEEEYDPTNFRLDSNFTEISHRDLKIINLILEFNAVDIKDLGEDLYINTHIELMIKFCKFYGIEWAESALTRYYAMYIFPTLSVSEIKRIFFIDSENQCMSDDDINKKIDEYEWVGFTGSPIDSPRKQLDL